MTAALERVSAVVRLELLTQRREPLTVLYMLVLGLLSAVFAAAGPVELVRDRGAVPRDAAWSVMLALTSLTAFGQIITTMVASTVVLRDRTDRIDELLIATRLTSREYRSGKLVAALIMLSVIYSAIPIGLMAGVALAGGRLGMALSAVLPPFVFVVLPTMLAVGALQFGIGVLSGRLWVIVGQGLVLIWLWSASISAVGALSGGAFASLIDPFGSAPLLLATRTWTDMERASRTMPVSSLLLLNRAIWLALGAAVAALAIRSRVRSPASHAASASSSREAVNGVHELRPIVRAPAGASFPALAVLSTARYVSRWLLRDPGWQVLTALGAVNVAVHALLDARGATSAKMVTTSMLAALLTHSRLFLILLATIYAGELVWREREERSDRLFDAQPVGDGALLLGRVTGVVIAEAVLVAILASAAVLAATAGALRWPDFATVLPTVVGRLALPFVLWTLLALAVHAVVQQKVLAHLLLIAGWVLIVLAAGGSPDGSESPLPGSVAVILCVVAAGVARICWARGERQSARWKWRFR